MDTGIKITIDERHHFASPYQQLATFGVLNAYANNLSAHGFEKGLKKSGIIDHIFTATGLRWGIFPDSYHGKFPSDHFPVLAKMRMA